MMKTYTVTDKIHTSTIQCRVSLLMPTKSVSWLDRTRHSNNRSVAWGGLSSNSSSSCLSLIVSTSSQPQTRKLSAFKRSADSLRLGSLTDDGLSYKESLIVRSYEVGINKTATVETMANLLQEVGCNHAQSMGFSTDGFATTPTMRKLHLIWVTNRVHIEIYRYPAWSDVVEIETWCQREGKIGTRRDFIMKDYATSEVIGRATSKWVIMNQDTRRLERVSNEIHQEYLNFSPRTLRLAFPEHNNKSLRRIPKLEDPADYFKQGLVPRRADFDMNQHVNNVTYIGWILESVPEEVLSTHELQSITVEYKRECQCADVVDSLSTKVESVPQVNVANGSLYTSQEDNQDFLHLLRLSGNGDIINLGRTEWRRKPRR